MDGREVAIPSWETAAQEDWLDRWAMNLMLINVSTRRFGRAVQLPRALTATKIGVLDRPVNDEPKARRKTLSHYLIKVARLGG